MLQVRFSNHELIKNSMIYLYIRPDIKKDDTAAKATAINKACIG